jgi:Tfp pilus assembly protein PilO
MIRTLKGLFLTRALREKLLLLVLLLIGVAYWFSSFLGRATFFMSEQSHTTKSLANQARWIASRTAVQKQAEKAAAAFKSDETLDGTRLIAALQNIASSSGLNNPSINGLQDLSVEQFAVHPVQFTVTKVSFESLVTFVNAVQERNPYIGIEQFQVMADKANPAVLNASMKISSVEITKGIP